MVALFAADSLFVTPDTSEPGESADHAFLAPDGSLVATARDRTGTVGRWARAAFVTGRTSHVGWDVLDEHGNRLLDVVKEAQRFGRLRVTASLLDGTSIGHAVGERFAAIPAVTLHAADDRECGRLVPALGDRRAHPVLTYRVAGPDGAPVGEIAQRFAPGTGFDVVRADETRLPPAIRDGAGFHLELDPGVALPLRVTAIAYTLCLLQQRTMANPM